MDNPMVWVVSLGLAIVLMALRVPQKMRKRKIEVLFLRFLRNMHRYEKMRGSQIRNLRLYPQYGRALKGVRSLAHFRRIVELDDQYLILAEFEANPAGMKLAPKERVRLIGRG
jgi:hypothetical protein